MPNDIPAVLEQLSSKGYEIVAYSDLWPFKNQGDCLFAWGLL